MVNALKTRNLPLYPLTERRRVLDKAFFETPELVPLLSHRRPDVRQWAADRLRSAGTPPDLKVLCEALAKEFVPEVIRTILDLLEDRELPPVDVFAVTLQGLIRHGHSKTVLQLVLSCFRKPLDAKSRRILLSMIIKDSDLVEGLQSLFEKTGQKSFYADMKGVLNNHGDKSWLIGVLSHMKFLDHRRDLHWAMAWHLAETEEDFDGWGWLSNFIPGLDLESNSVEPRVVSVSECLTKIEAILERENDHRGLLERFWPEERFEQLRQRAWEDAEAVRQSVRDLVDGLRWAQAAGFIWHKSDELSGMLHVFSKTLTQAFDNPCLSRPQETLSHADPSLASVENSIAERLADWTASGWPQSDQGIDAIVAAVRPDEKDSFCRHLRERLKAPSGDDGSAHIQCLQALRRLEGFESINVLWENMKEDCLDRVEEQVRKEFLKLGPSVMERLDSLAASADRRQIYVFRDLAERYPGNQTGEWLRRHASKLFTRLSQEAVIASLCGTGSLWGIEALQDAYRPGEGRIAEALLFLAELHRIALPNEKALRQDVSSLSARRQKDREEAAGGFPSQAFLHPEGPTTLPLRCRQCRREYHYEVKEIWATAIALKENKNPAELAEEIGFDRLICCKRCEAVEDWEFGPYGLAQVMGEFVRSALIAKSPEKPGLPESDAGEDESELMAAGKRIGRIRTFEGFSAAGKTWTTRRAALAYLLAESGKLPEDSNLWVRLGNMYRHGKLLDLGKEAYQKALSLSPTDAEAHFNLANLLYSDEDDPRSARPHYVEVLRALRGKLFLSKEQKEWFSYTLETLASIDMELGILPPPIDLSADAWVERYLA